MQRMQTKRALQSVVLLLTLGLALSGSALYAVPHAITIAQARHLPLGTEVTVEGRTSTPSGAFESSFFDKGFGLQDLTAGIFISSQTNLGANPFDRVRVTGVLQDSFGLLILVPADPSDVHILGRGLPVIPLWVHTGTVGEGTEGRIVRVVGHISQAPSSDLPFGYKFAVDDGSGEIQIFINLQTGIDVSGLHLGQLVSVAGFSSQFDTHYEIDPRSPADIQSPGH